MSKSTPQATPPPPKPHPLRFGWGYGAVAAGLAVLLTVVGYASHRAMLEQQMHRYAPSGDGELFTLITKKLSRERNPGYMKLSAINTACWAVEAVDRGERNVADARGAIEDSAALDLSNGVYNLLRLHLALDDGSAPADARFAAIKPILESLKGRPIDFGLATFRDVWAGELAFEYGDQATARFVASEVLAPRHLSLRRKINDRAIQLVDALIAGNHPDEAAELAIAMVNWSAAALRNAADVDEVYVSADATADAQNRRAIIAAMQNNADAESAARHAEQRARSFRKTLHNRIDAEPINLFGAMEAFRNPTTAREQPYRNAVLAALAAGVMLTGAAAACAIAVAAAILFAIIAIVVKPQTPTWQPAGGAWSIIGVSVLPLAPAAALLVGLRLMPINLTVITNQGWLLSFFYIMAAAVAFLALALAVKLARAAMTESWGLRVWPIYGVALAAVLYLLLFAPFGISPAKTPWWESSDFPPIAQLRINQLAAFLVVLLILAPLVGMASHVIKGFRRRPGEPSPALRVKALLKHLCILACLWWFVFAGFGMLGVSYAANARSRFNALDLADLEHPVAARMGPNWADVFFPPTN